ncbi:NUDIX domain-containing protein [Halobaculum gomorrense]|uniref:Translation initiation factor 2B subunit, eIF-2B alpha/beta/delta family n=1 Tax=Halobaculum gomorrense TaxID=43928 RepID=A0A1M5LTL3_9EURY|nr:NUDIX domain-containing protein [Halobaculum gomorrense]SHG67713.1 Translation initiation factor 2B subunit, eIF-2B alpha/beta/delta family [Halobaculum gomorrense]
MAHVVTAFLRNRGAVLLVRRSDAVSTYRGRWGGISGYVEGDADDALDDALREIREETGIAEGDLSPVRRGDPIAVDDEQDSFTVHPFLFDCATRRVRPNEELAETEWIQPIAMLERETVPSLWDAYRAVGPTVATVAGDRTHGSASISLRALEALRDEAAEATLANDDGGSTDDDGDNADDDGWARVADTARALRDARPGMTALATRVNRVMSEADRREASTRTGNTVTRERSEAGRTPTAVRDRAIRAVDAAADADDRAAREATALLADRGDGDDGESAAVLTLSRSGTVAAALERLNGPAFVAESEPGGEGREVAASLAADAGTDRAAHDDRGVTLLPDSAVASLLAEGRVDAALVGADAVLPDGGVANKVGTRGLALAAAREDVPVYAVTACDKIAPDGAAFHPERADFEAPEGVDPYAPLFDCAPDDTVTIVTEDGVLDADAVRAAAERHRALAAWDRADDADARGDDGKE